jgi:pimeloyl-ACP methyl ester carboxylesterase
MPPETRYARSGDYHIAYQVVGDGLVDLVLIAGWVSHLEYQWESPAFARLYGRLASFARLILFDKRGVCMSDRVPMHEVPTLEERMDDVRAVMDAIGSERAFLLGASEGGPMSILFAATYPELVAGLVTYAAYARRAWAPGRCRRRTRGWGRLRSACVGTGLPDGFDPRRPAGVSRRRRTELGQRIHRRRYACPEPSPG